jgi:transglutaminase-like putative cysteine protease
MSFRKAYLFGIFLCVTQGLFSQIAVETAWLPITDAEKNQKAPLVDKTAGVEALFWRVHVWDEVVSSDWQRHRVNYVRLKVFNEEGKKKVSSFEFPYGNDISVTQIDARTIQPDGTIVVLKKEDIHEREVVRLGGIRRKVKSFAFPAVEPGAIVEYRVREVHFKQQIRYLHAQIQQEYPIQKMTYFVKPLSRDYINMTMRVWPFNCRNSPLNLEMNGFTSTTVENLPAFQEEPYMISEANVRAWILFFYAEGDRRDPNKYWEKRGKDIYTQLKQSLRVNDEIRQAAAKAVEGATDEQQKVVALIGYLRTNLRSIFDPAVTDAERGKIIKSMPKERARTSEEVFKSGISFPNELNTLFAAMAQAVGLEARPALVADRNNVLFEPRLADSYFLDNIDMAVKIGGNWKLFDASTKRLPPNMVGWGEEGTQALVSDPKAPVFIQTPLSPPGESTSLRRGNFRLAEDGTLEGDVQLYYTGHAAADRREGKVGDAPEKQQEEVKEMVTGPFPSAEVTEIKLENVENTSQALAYKYHVRIPGFAQRTGKRLLFSPLYFQHGATPRFSASERKYPIAFRYAWQEDDEIRIKIPAGFKIDNGENPGNLDFGPPGAYKLTMGLTKDGHFVVGRVLEFGRGGAVMFDTKAYPALKQLFDEFHRRDGTIISLKQEAQ